MHDWSPRAKADIAVVSILCRAKVRVVVSINIATTNNNNTSVHLHVFIVLDKQHSWRFDGKGLQQKNHLIKRHHVTWSKTYLELFGERKNEKIQRQSCNPFGNTADNMCLVATIFGMPIGRIVAMEMVNRNLSEDKSDQKRRQDDNGQGCTPIGHASSVEQGHHRVRQPCLQPTIGRPKTKSHQSSDQVHFEQLNLTKVGHHWKAKTRKETKEQCQTIETKYSAALSSQIIAVVLLHLFVAYVDS